MQITPLARTSPEAQGIPSATITEFLTRAEQSIDRLHSFMLLRHGAVVAEAWWFPYRRHLSHMLYSISKSFTSTAVGLAVSEGLFTVDEPVLSFFPNEAPRKISPFLAAMKVHHLLAMSTGHDQDPTEVVVGSYNPFRTFLSLPVDHQPGTHFVYNTAASFMLAAIVQKRTGQTLLAYLTPRLFEPLGIVSPVWDSHPNGVNFGGFGLHLKTEEIARFGQLYLQKGLWNGRRLIPEDWVALATAKHTDNSANLAPDWKQGYGYQFWRCQPAGVYRADGAMGQFCVVMPEQDAVLAVTGGLNDMQLVLDLAWELFLPSMQTQSLPEDPQGLQALGSAAQNLAIRRPEGEPYSSTLESAVSRNTYHFKANPLRLQSVRFDFGANTLILQRSGGDSFDSSKTLTFGRNAWREGHADLGVGLFRIPIPTRAETSGTWTSANTFALTICLVETPYIVTLSFTFTSHQVTLNYKANVSYGPVELTGITGHLRRG